MAAAGDRRGDERHRREGQQQEQQYLGEDDPDRERAQEQDRAELADEEDEREAQPLELAALLHRVGGGLVGDPEPVARLGRVGFGQLGGVAVVQRFVLFAAFVLTVARGRSAGSAMRTCWRC